MQFSLLDLMVNGKFYLWCMNFTHLI